MYMEKAIDALQQADYEICDDQISHIYLMMLEHLNLISEYRFPVGGRALTRRGSFPVDAGSRDSHSL